MTGIKGCRDGFSTRLMRLRYVATVVSQQSIFGENMNLNTKNSSSYNLESLKKHLMMLKKHLDDETIKKYANNLEKQIIGQVAIIKSMTHEEKMDPSILDNSRLQRIASGSGQEINDIYLLLKQYKRMKKMILKFNGNPNGKEPPPAVAVKMLAPELPDLTDAIAQKQSA